MKTTTHYNLILDASGSMSDVQIQTLNALNNQIEDCRRLAADHPEADMKISLTLFNATAKALYTNLSPVQAPLITRDQYQPSGGTALLDALGMSIAETRQTMQPGDDAVLVVLTDGQENASQFYTYEQMAETIANLKKTELWSFSFVGADFEAWDIASRLNIDREEVISSAKADMKNSFETMNNSLSEYIKLKSEGTQKKGFFKQ